MNAPKDNFIVVAGGSDLARECIAGEKSLDLAGINDSRKLLSAAGLEFKVFLITPNYLRKNLRFPLDDYKVMFNVITDADINPKVLQVLERLLKDTRIPIINHPAKLISTTRDQVAARLEGIDGLVVSKTLRLDRRNKSNVKDLIIQSSFRFPGILRPIGTHGGEGVRVVRDLNALMEHLIQLKKCYLTEFSNYKSDDGFYRKYRCFFIAEEIIFRHLIISDNWSIHARDKKRVMINHNWMSKEEEAIHSRGIGYFSPGQIATMRKIQKVLDLDYFGLDFSITKSGRLLLFEANATMNFFPFFTTDQSHYSWQCLPRAVDAIRRLVEGRLT